MSASLLAISGCGSPVARTRQRISLTATTPEGVTTGSGVIEISGYVSHGIDTPGSTVSSIRGEAVVLDLGTRGFLCWLLKADPERKGSSGPGYVSLAFPELARQIEAEASREPDKGKRFVVEADLLTRLKPVGEIPLKNIGLLVHFRDPNDPRSVERVDPFDMAAIFGRGVSLIKATMAITDDPITRGIEKKLPWLLTPDKNSWIIPFSRPDTYDRSKVEGTLEHNDFWRGMK